MPSEQDKHESADQLELELRQLLSRLEERPVPDELRILAEELQDALEKQRPDRRPE